MPRSIKKGPFVDQYLIDKISKMTNANKTAVKTWSRRSLIIPDFVGYLLHYGYKQFL